MSSLREENPVLFAILVILGSVLVWRGFWGLLDFYLFPSYPELSFWLSLFWGLILLGATDVLTKGEFI